MCDMMYNTHGNRGVGCIHPGTVDADTIDRLIRMNYLQAISGRVGRCTDDDNSDNQLIDT